eukprot:TRINITY_DN9122_c0_g1_i1.p1 TRINITY_DN9122_c0_g1~~TRINITY_DN9122_c0_g1_i1.p1  ORF type:complete len:336 (+),score=112.15 TRINITY_DN9122_c0_g1_i1:78-1085(+)
MSLLTRSLLRPTPMFGLCWRARWSAERQCTRSTSAAYSSAAPPPVVHAVFDEATCTAQYVVACAESKEAAIVDSVLDFDPVGVKLSTGNIEKLMAVVEENGYHPKWIVDTHVHADHISGMGVLKQRFCPEAKTVISHNVSKVQGVFSELLNVPIATDGSQFDVLVREGTKLQLGSHHIEAMCTPGHTPACTSYVIRGHCVFVGDTLFMPDSGTARCDFPMGSAHTLYGSIQKLLALEPNTKVYLCHDYRAGGSREEFQWETSVEEELAQNIHLVDADESSFVAKREARDKILNAPKLLWQSLSFNICAGLPPPPDDNGASYIRLPLRNLKDVFKQ